MLNKEACKRCNNKYHGYREWNHDDDEFWEEGSIVCLSNLYIRKIHDPPPEDCLYKLEHMILSQDDKDKGKNAQ